MTPTVKGALACAKLDQRAIEKGAVVSIPAWDARYDRVVDWEGRLYRVQVKYCDRNSSNSDNAIAVHLQSYGHSRLTSGGYGAHEVDAVAVYIPRVDALCWFEPAEFDGKTALVVRLAPPKNGQVAGVRLYEDYLW